MRNIIQDCPSSIDAAIDLLINENLIKKSLILPFRYIKAVEEIEKIRSEHASKVIQALNKAAEISLYNVPTFEGSTLVALDISGSMAGAPITIGSLFAAALIKNNNADLMLFSETAQYYSPNIQDSLISLALGIKSKATYGGTNFHAIFLGSQIKYTRIIILSDMQAWMNPDASLVQTLESYKKRHHADPFIYSFDLNGYGPLQFPSKRVFCLAGFSDKIFDFMRCLETDSSNLIDRVNAIEL